MSHLVPPRQFRVQSARQRLVPRLVARDEPRELEGAAVRAYGERILDRRRRAGGQAGGEMEEDTGEGGQRVLADGRSRAWRFSDCSSALHPWFSARRKSLLHVGTVPLLLSCFLLQASPASSRERAPARTVQGDEAAVEVETVAADVLLVVQPARTGPTRRRFEIGAGKEDTSFSSAST